MKLQKTSMNQDSKLNLEKISSSELIQRMEKLVRTERKITHLVLLHIAEIEARKIHIEMGFDGMYSYLTRGLGYSEGAAYRRLQSARLLKQVPSLAEKIENGSLNLTQLTQVKKSIKESTKQLGVRPEGSPKQDLLEKALDVLAKIENKNSFETQKTLALEMSLPVRIHEKIKPQSDSSIRLEVTLSQDQFQELEAARNLLSHSCPDGNWADVIATLAQQFNRKKMVGKDKPNKSTQAVIATAVNQAPCAANRGQVRKSIPVSKKRFLLNKAQQCCEYQDPKTGKRCSSKFHLQIDHIQPVALGGCDDLTNLRVLCQAHNIFVAQKMGLIRKDARDY